MINTYSLHIQLFLLSPYSLNLVLYSLYDRLYLTSSVAQTACRRQRGALFLIGYMYLFLDIAQESFFRDIPPCNVP